MVRPGYCAGTVTLKTATPRRATTYRRPVPRQSSRSPRRTTPHPGPHREPSTQQPSNPAQKKNATIFLFPASFPRPQGRTRNTPGFTDNTPPGPEPGGRAHFFPSSHGIDLHLPFWRDPAGGTTRIQCDLTLLAPPPEGPVDKPYQEPAPEGRRPQELAASAQEGIPLHRYPVRPGPPVSNRPASRNVQWPGTSVRHFHGHAPKR